MDNLLNLVPVDEREDAARILYQILLEREGADNVNISHKAPPSFDQHCAFVANHPYGAWYLIEAGSTIVGSVYLTKPPRPSIAGNEFGIFIFAAHQGKGYAKHAVRMVMEKHGPGRYLANINPKNSRSLALFLREGFDLCQFTLEKNVT